MNASQIPVMRVGPDILVSLQGDITDDAVAALEGDIAGLVQVQPTRGVLIDVRGLLSIDSFIARVLDQIARVVTMLGSRPVICGIRPAMAITLVELGLYLEGMDTALDPGQGVELLAVASGG